MNRKQERKYSMYKAVSSFLKGTLASIIAKMPLMDNAMAKLENLILEIADLGEAQETNRTGYAENKELTKESVANTIFVLAGQVKSFAVNTDNQVLKNEVNYSLSKLESMADTRLLTTADRIIAKANLNIAELADYGVTPTLLTEITELVEKYSTKIAEPRNATSQQVEETVLLEEAFKTTDKLLIDKMDTYVIIVRNSDPEFYNMYHSNRKIIGPGYKRLAMRCKIKDEQGQPLEKVTAVIESTNKKYKTTAKGTFLVKSLPDGMHNIEFTRANYETLKIQFPTTKGLRTDLNITLKQL